MAYQEPEILTIRNAQLVYKNFRGEKKQFNMEGDMNFCVLLEYPQAMDLMRDGWSGIKPYKNDIDAGIETPRHTLKTRVRFNSRPPRCYLVTSGPDGNGAKTLLGADMVSMFDNLESVNVDIAIVAYNYEVSGRKGKSAYLRTLFYTMYEDELELEYRNFQVIPAVGGPSAKEIESAPNYDIEGSVVL